MNISDRKLLFSLLVSGLLFVPLLTPGSARKVRAQDGTSPAGETTEDGEKTSRSYPFIAEVSGGEVRMRGGPGKKFKPIGRVSEGLLMVVREKKQDWYRVDPPPEAGLWIYGKFVEKTGGETGKVTGTSVNLRPIPAADRSNAPVTQISKPAEVHILEHRPGESNGDPGWYRIRAPEDTPVWIHSRFLSYKHPYELGHRKKLPGEAGEEAREKIQKSEFTKTLKEIERSIKAEENKPELKRNFVPMIDRLRRFERECDIEPLVKRARDQRRRLEEIQSVIETSVQTLNRQLERIQRRRKENVKRTLSRILKSSSRHFIATGYLESYGNVLGRPAKYQLVKGEERLYFVQAPELDLEKYRGRYVGISGTTETLSDQWNADLLTVDEIQIIK